MSSFVKKLLAFSLLFNACGKSEQKVQTVSSKGKTSPTSGDGTNSDETLFATLTDPNCKAAASCNEVVFTIVDEVGHVYIPTTSATGASVVADPSLIKSGAVGAPVQWSLAPNVTTATAPIGRIMLAPLQVPTWITLTNATDSSGRRSKSLSGTPDATAVVANGALVFIVRDMVRCKVTESDPDNKCKSTATLSYDKYVSVPYSIGAGNGVMPIQSPGVYPTPMPTNCAQAQNGGGVVGGIAGMFFPPLGAIISGSPKVNCY